MSSESRRHQTRADDAGVDQPRTGDDQPNERRLLVLLGAGGGSRYSGDTHKLNAPLGDTTVVGTAVSSAVAAGAGDVAIVVGAAQLDGIDDSVVVIHNPHWRTGQSSSLQAAANYARANRYDAIIVALADQPAITPTAWRAVAHSSAPIAFATYGGQRGHPMRFTHAMWDRFPSTGDHGARHLLDSVETIVEGVACDGSASDIDTVEDLSRWQKN